MTEEIAWWQSPPRPPALRHLFGEAGLGDMQQGQPCCGRTFQMDRAFEATFTLTTRPNAKQQQALDLIAAIAV